MMYNPNARYQRPKNNRKDKGGRAIILQRVPLFNVEKGEPNRKIIGYRNVYHKRVLLEQ